MNANDAGGGVPSSEGMAAMSRRDMLMAATVAAGTLAAAPPALSDAGGFGHPVVQLFVPGGLLTREQRADLIKGVTGVVLGTMKQPPDPTGNLFVEIFETAVSVGFTR